MKPENILYYTVSHTVPQLGLFLVGQYIIFYLVSLLIYKLSQSLQEVLTNNSRLPFITGFLNRLVQDLTDYKW